jgi:DNA-binding XRE family transcriptional regulator
MPTLTEHEHEGRRLVLNGQLEDLRDKLGLTRSGMAELLNMSPMTYTKCERDSEHAGNMSRATAERLGRFSWLAEMQLLQLQDEGIDLAQLIPLPIVASTYGLPQEVLMSWHRTGVISAEDLGILGLWIYRQDEAQISDAVARR